MPQWLKKRIVTGSGFDEMRRMLSGFSINTVCELSRCPNITECFSSNHATFIILGRRCTRRCAFCLGGSGHIQEPDGEEPVKIAQFVSRTSPEYVVITSVTRDDLPDGGAGQFVKTIDAIRASSPDAALEVLVPDFGGSEESARLILNKAPAVFAHNIDAVKNLYDKVKPDSDYDRSIRLLETVKNISPHQMTKSAILVGLGEEERDVVDTMHDLKEVHCDILAIGQYLRPSADNIQVSRFVPPEEFERYRMIGEEMGIKHISAGAFVRSSYLAKAQYVKAKERHYDGCCAALAGRGC